MERYIGIDAHSETCTVAVMGSAGRRLREAKVETQGKMLRELIGMVPRRRHVCLEEGAQSEWLYELLEPLVEEIVVVRPQKREGPKSDSIDAWSLADGLRRGVLPTPVFKAPGSFTGLRQAMRAHQLIQRDLVRAKQRVKALYQSRGLRRLGNSVYEVEARATCLKELPRHHRRLATLLSDELDALAELAAEAEDWLQTEAKRTPAVNRLATAPGIGTIRAAQIVAVVVSPHRFRTRKQFWSYCGLGVVTRSSADYGVENGQLVRRKSVSTRGLNRNRNPMLKNVFKGAAKTVTNQMMRHPLRADYIKMVEGGTKANLAQLTIARRIAALTLAMWKNQEDYDPARNPSS
jgi:transposase